MCSCKSDAEILLKFKKSLKDNGALSNWNDTKPPCSGYNENWVGIICGNGTVWGAKLENMGLEGVIDVDALKELKNLRTISLMNNKFDGSLPNITELGALKSIYLSDNQFSGAIPIGIFNGMLSLKKVHLARNKFSGEIPQSLITLPILKELMLQDNEFEGEIPQFRNGMLKSFNVSDNELTGEIPRGLSHLNATSFLGNKGLCGAPLKSCAPVKLSIGTIIIVVILVALAIAALIAVVVILSRRKQMQDQEQATVSPPGHRKAHSTDLDKMEHGGASPEHRTNGKKGNNNTKLTFLQDDREKFDMGDLLKASAEILGSGIFGSTYKASLNARQVMVVKRFRYMNNVGKEEFHEHMRRLGRMSHQNVLPIVAFYYRKEEKLLVSDYMENINLAVHLHGNTSRGHPCPDWPTRLNIIKGVAKGLLYLYNELPGLVAPHGHLKSSNVLLDRSFNPLLTDYGLVPVVNQDRAQEHMIAYKSPEYKTGRITKKTDVWSLGMLILEIMTGRFPSSFLQQGSKGNDTDLVSWVESMVKEANSNVDQVFDKNMGGKLKSEGEMMKLLQIGLNCCEAEVDKRWDLKEAVERIEQVKEKDNDNDNDQEYNSRRFSN
ncbi:unnamed protein product [Fraxinus pennsylvanica]|uniref:Protein kinase domain-containing protein n=1 Tax=Fraxinus pennsylvanica TaxID=56036 RepID=A0AAD2A3H5_9LAMI|nr:unnamed protein product [Fraxinus pennsylvanica]